METVLDLIGEKVEQINIADLRSGDKILLETKSGIRIITIGQLITDWHCEITIEYSERQPETSHNDGITRTITTNRKFMIGPGVVILPIAIGTYYQGRMLIQTHGYEIISSVTEIRLIPAKS